jgi:hypothetical protein
LLNVPSLPAISPGLLMTLRELTFTGGQNPQQLLFALAVFWQMMCWVVSPWNV